MAEKKRKTYVEPSEYFPKEIRKEFGLGEYWDGQTKEKGKTKTEKKKKK